MKRSLAFAASLLLLVGAYSLLLKASIASVPSGTWSAAPLPAMSMPRAGASAALLPDGRVLVSGGVGDAGVTATADRYSPNGGLFLAAPSMQGARANHTSTLLSGRRVLVTGGTGADGNALNTAEIYDSTSNSWILAGPLSHARQGHTATRLSDGRVLIAGGQDGGAAIDTLEIFDPALEIFTAVNATLSAPRARHAAALLADGRVLIVGGFDGTNLLASVDVYDPANGSVSAGPAISGARADHSATTLLNGKVVVAGGVGASGELAAGTVFDPTTGAWSATANTLAAPRQRHLAFLLPHNNNVLIVGGISGGSTSTTAELYVPWQGVGGTFVATGAPSVARQLAAGSALSLAASETNRSGPADGLLLLAGGTGAASAELYGFATVKTDKEDYAPGETVTITGSGWQPGETVALTLVEEPLLDIHPLVAVTADNAGNILSTEFVPDQHDIGIRFYLTATGAASQVQTTFRDTTNITTASVTINESTCTNPTSSFAQGQTVCAKVTITGVGGGGGVGDFFILWLNPSSVAVQTTTKAVPATVPSPFTDTFPTTLLSPTGTWTVQICKTAACNGNNLVASATFTLGQPPKLTLVKTITNDNGGTAAATDWTLSASGPTPISGTTGSAAVTNASVTPGTYSLSESGPTGYTPSAWSCVKNAGAPVGGSSIALAPNDTATCTINNNDQAAHLIIIKQVVNDNGGTKVAGNFSGSISGVTVSGGNTWTGTVTPGVDKTLTTVGSYSITETADPAYTTTYSTGCSGTIALGETKTCTVTNDDKAAHLVVIKHVINDNGGAKVASDFSLTIGGVTATGGQTFNGAESPGTDKTLTTVGAYTVTEGAHVGYGVSASADCSGTIALGETKTCTITNDDIQPKLTVTKTVVNDNGGTAGVSDFILKVGTTVVTSGVETGFNAATYAITETGPSGYASTFGGACAGGSVTLAVGEVKSCTITNDDIQPKLTVTKTVVNDNGGTAGVGDFVLKVGTTVVTSGVETGFNAATYAITETGPSGYATTFGGACAGGSVTLAVGEVKSCTITNDDIQPKLTVTKTVVNDNGGTAGVGDFVLKVGTTVVTSGVETGFNAATYAITETGPSGYASTFGGACAGGSVTLAVGEVKSCTITNDDIQPKLTVTKTVINDNGGTAGVGDFVLKVGTTVVTSGVETGFNAATYAITETGPSGYASTFGGACAGGSVTLAVGEVKSCTITNDDIQPKLTVTKTVINDNGGTAGVGDFVLKVGTTVVTSGVETGFNAATYAITETGPSGYASTFGGACAGGSVTLAVGEVKSCTITNDDIQPKLTVTKTVINDNGGTAGVGDFVLKVGTTVVTSGVETGFNAATYAITETGPSGYASTFGGACAGGSVTLAVGEVKSCTITNDDQAPSLTLVKTVINDNGGTATANAFTLTASGPTPLSGAGGGTSGATFSAGSYALSETALSGYTASAWVCTGTGTQTGSTIALANGQAATCTITNDDQAPSLTLVKTVINNNGGTATASAFTLTASGPTPISGTGGASSGATFSAGSYGLSETGPSGYTASAWVCVGGTQTGSTIALANGQAATCTITNDDQAPSLTLVKTVINNNGGTATANAFTLTASGPTPLSGAGGATSGPTFSAGSYALSETALSGYTASAWVCVGGTQTGSTIALANGQAATCTITNDDQAPSLTLVKTVINNNGGTATANAFTLTASGPTPLSGAGGATSGPTFSAGSYALSETALAGYAASAWVCVGGSQTGSTIALANGQAATCTITNDDIQPKLIVIKHVINDNGGTSTAANFAMTVTGSSPSPGSFPGSESGTTVMLNAGSYSVSETLPIAYASSLSADCTGSIAVGETKTCTVTNNDTYLPLGTMCLGSPGHSILQPINTDNSSVFKQKSTVPAKFRVCDVAGHSVGTPGVVTDFRLIQIVSGTVADVDEAVDSTTPDTVFRWSATDQQWIFNINTKPLQISNTYVYRITLNDGSTIQFQFGLK